jgi:serine/threonine protein kinase
MSDIQGSGRDEFGDESRPKESAGQGGAGGSGDDGAGPPPGGDTATDPVEPQEPKRPSVVRRYFDALPPVFVDGADIAFGDRTFKRSFRLGSRFASEGGAAAGKSVVWKAVDLDDDARPVLLKVFSSPKYPNDQERNDPNIGPSLLRRCTRFEQRHTAIGERLNPRFNRSPRGGEVRRMQGGDPIGLLVRPIAFGRPDRQYAYVKVYPWVEGASSLSRGLAATWTAAERIVVIRSLLLGLWELHRVGVVHGDIKPENVLIIQQPIGPVARLIDYDDGYLANDPPTDPGGDGIGTTILTPEWKVVEGEIEPWGEDPAAPRPGLGFHTDMFQLAVTLNEVFAEGPKAIWAAVGAYNDDATTVADGFVPKFSDLSLGREFGVAGEHLAFELSRCMRRNGEPRPSVKSLLASVGVVAP